MIHPPKDIFSDAYMTAQPKPRVKAICAFTALGEEGLRAAMMGGDGAVVQVSGPQKHSASERFSNLGKSARKVGIENERAILGLLAELGEASSRTIADRFGISQQTAASKLQNMHRDRIVTRHKKPKLRGWIYRAAQTQEGGSAGKKVEAKLFGGIIV